MAGKIVPHKTSLEFLISKQILLKTVDIKSSVDGGIRIVSFFKQLLLQYLWKKHRLPKSVNF